VEWRNSTLTPFTNSDYSVAPMSTGLYSYAQTGPSSNQYGSSWDTTGEGQQHFNENFPLSYSTGALTPPGADLDFVTAEDYQRCASPRPEKRLHSRSPGVGGTKRRNTKSSSTSSRTHAKIAPAPSSGSAKASMAGNATSAAFRSNGAQFPDMGQGLYLETGASWPTYQDPMTLADLSIASDGMQFPGLSDLHVDPAHMQIDPDPSLSATSPHASWASYTPPQSPPDDAWYQPSIGGGSSAESAASSPPADFADPKYGYELVHGMTNGDLSATVVADDSYRMAQGPSSRRGRTDGETPARDHHLYKNAAPGTDGLFHCPWEGTKECHHKPEKLKCNYE
jgi:hypothetical protein